MKLKMVTIVGWLPAAFAATFVGVQATTGATLKPSATLEIKQAAGPRALASVDGNSVMLPSSEAVRPDMYQVSATVGGQRRTAWVRVRGDAKTQIVISQTGLKVSPRESLVMQQVAGPARASID